MNKIFRFAWVSLFAASGSVSLMTGCSKKTANASFLTYNPVYASKASVLAGLNGSASQPVDSAGKVYVLGNTIFLNDLNKGIHIIDNTDPSHPVSIAFLSIPGNQDIAVKGSTLYADMYQDLLAIDISDPRHAKITGTIPDLFSMRSVVNGVLTNNDDQVVTGWVQSVTTAVVGSEGRPGGLPLFPGGCRNCPIFYANGASVPAAASSAGVAGSMASMVLIDDYLYAISEQHSLGIVGLADASRPVWLQEMSAGYDLETIYPFRNQLFLGSAEGVYIYDLNNPAHPTQVGEFSHGHACDPVIADGNYAYVTLHSGTSCGGASNELDIINVQSPSLSQVAQTYPMIKPMGLCKDGSLLFVCDGNTGVKVYDASNTPTLKYLSSTGGGQAYDVIASNQHLLVVANDGLYQYDYSNPSNLRLLSLLPVPVTSAVTRNGRP